MPVVKDLYLGGGAIENLQFDRQLQAVQFNKYSAVGGDFFYCTLIHLALP